MRAMRGQALVEMAVAAAFIVPLFLLVPIIAKYGHTKQMAQQAARNAAWEATVASNYQLPSRGQLQAKVLDRSFARADDPIRSNAGGARTGEFGDEMLNTFSGKKLMERDNVRVTNIANERAPGFVSRVIDGVPRLPCGDFSPNPKGYTTAEIQLNLRNLTTRDGRPATYLAPFDNLNLVINQKHTLLADAWNASGPTAGTRSVKAAITPLTLTCMMEPIAKVFNVIGSLPLPIINKLNDLDFGTIEPDIIPTDRLARYPVNGP